MKGKVLLFVGLLVLFGLFIFFRFVILDVRNTDGQLRITSSPAASIFINNVAVSKTPFDAKYKAGEYTIKLIPEVEATATATWQKKIKVEKKSVTYINIELGSTDLSSAGVVLYSTKSSVRSTLKDQGGLAVESDPPNALIYLDNDEKGVSTLEMTDIPKGDHELSVFMPGFIRYTQKINITPGYKVVAYVKLAIDPSQNPPLQPDKKTATSSAETTLEKSTSSTTVVIKGTPDGWLRVRDDATVNASESARVNEGDTFEVIEEKNNWYKIKYDGTREGWISAEYAQVK